MGYPYLMKNGPPKKKGSFFFHSNIHTTDKTSLNLDIFRQLEFKRTLPYPTIFILPV